MRAGRRRLMKLGLRLGRSGLIAVGVGEVVEGSEAGMQVRAMRSATGDEVGVASTVSARDTAEGELKGAVHDKPPLVAMGMFGDGDIDSGFHEEDLAGVALKEPTAEAGEG